MYSLLNISVFGYHFVEPLWLFLLPLVLFFIVFRQNKRNNESNSVKFTKSSKVLTELEDTRIPILLKIAFGSLLVGVSILFLALLKPVKTVDLETTERYGEGIDIILSMDISGSMMATDFTPNRLEAAKEMAKEFITNRKSDRIGLVVYEGEAYTACPATLNHDFLKDAVGQVQSGWLEPGTAIGVGLGTAVARLRDEDLVSKVVILLSDGENNKGSITPLEAAELAKAKNVRVYTIGIGKDGYATMPVQTPFGTVLQNTKVSIDEKLLTQMAELTGGKYFRATDNESLRAIYAKIDALEKTKIVDSNLEKEPPQSPSLFLFLGGALVALSILLELVIYKRYA